jgi:2-phospho-L-lactate/phosphoenolpyruvate guanylyltransferase
MSTTAILPVKQLNSAKDRLAEAVTPGARASLAEAMFFDVLASARHCRHLDRVLIVTADRTIARQARWLGADVLEQGEDLGHREAASAGVRDAVARGADRVALLAADCPLLDPDELDRHLGSVPRSALIIPDRHGTGTNALILSPPDIFPPAFGPDSCTRHVALARRAGVAFSVERIESLALDLDTPDDLELLTDALFPEPERAPRTAKTLAELARGRETAEHATA